MADRPSKDELAAAEARAERARRRVEALEAKQARRAKQQPDRARAAKEKAALKPSRLTRGLAATDPTRKKGRK